MKSVHLHLVSDSSGETVSAVARAVVVQFEAVTVHQHGWWLVRTLGQVERVIAGVTEHPGIVFYTLVDNDARALLEDACERLGVPCMAILDPVLQVVASYLQLEIKASPGRQFQLDANYFARIEAMQYTLSHDDGQLIDDLERADIVLVGVSRTSKTPTSMYLANRGFKCANYPLVPQVELPRQISALTAPLVVGLTGDPKRLADIRLSRLKLLHDDSQSDYANLDRVQDEVRWARRIFTRHGWPVVDVTRKSIEEAAAAIMQLHQQTRAKAITLSVEGEQP